MAKNDGSYESFYFEEGGGDTGGWGTSSTNTNTNTNTTTTTPDTTATGAVVTGVQESSSKSSSSLPQFGEEYVKYLTGQYGNEAWNNYSSAVKNLSTAPKWIDQQRTLLNQQYIRDLQTPTMSTLKSGINNLTGRGMLNSSVSGDWLSNVASEMLQATQTQQTESNVWAASKKYENLVDQVEATKGFASLLSDYLGLTKASDSSSESSSTTYDYILGD